MVGGRLVVFSNSKKLSLTSQNSSKFIADVLKYSKQIFWQYFRWFVVGWWYLVSKKNFLNLKYGFKSFKNMFDGCSCTLCTCPNYAPTQKTVKNIYLAEFHLVGGRLVVGWWWLVVFSYTHKKGTNECMNLKLQQYCSKLYVESKNCPFDRCKPCLR